MNNSLDIKLRIAAVLFDLGHSQVKFFPPESEEPQFVEFRDQTRGLRTVTKTISYKDMAELVKGTDINSMKSLIDATIRRVLKEGVPLSDLDKWTNDPSVFLPRLKANKESLRRA